MPVEQEPLGRAQVVPLVAEPLHPPALAGAAQVVLRVVAECEEVARVGVAHRRLLAALRELLPGVLPDDGLHGEPRPIVAVVLADEAAVDERCEVLEDVDVDDRPGLVLAARGPRRSHELRGLQRESAFEHPQPGEQSPLVALEELRAPFDRPPDGLLASRQVAGPADQDGQPPIEPVEQFGGGEHPHARRRQLNRQRDAVERVADPLDGLLVVWRDLEVRLDGVRALDEEVDRLLIGERLDVEALLAADAQQHPAGDQDRELRGVREQCGESRRGVHDLLEIVEDEQDAALAQRGRQVLHDRRIAGVADAERLGDAVGHALGVVDR